MSDFITALRIAPDILGELRTKTQPEKHHTERTAPGHARTTPLALTPIDDADHLYALILEHTEAIADMLGTKPPTVTRWGHRRPMGFPAHTSPEAAFTNARMLCRFIEHQLPHVPDTDLIRIIENDITQAVFRLDNRYPSTAPKEHVKARCGNCDRLTVFRHPARSFGADEIHTCESCGLWMSEAGVVERRAARERELKARKKEKAG